MNHTCSTKYILPVTVTACSIILITVYAVYLATGPVDPDIFFIIKNGEDIITWGFPQKMLHTVLDINTVLQQSLTNILDYYFYKGFSFCGIYILSALEFILVSFAVYIYTTLKIKDPFIKYTACSFFLLPAATLLKGRPLIISMTLLFALLICTEKYKKTGKCCYIMVGYPVISLLQILFHASMWPFLICFAAAAVLDFAVHKDQPSTIMSLLGVIMMILIAIFNPYGIDNMLYLFNSLSVSSAPIQEMLKPEILSVFGLYAFICLAAFLLYITHLFDLHDLIPVLTFIACFVMSILYRRNLWLLSAGSAYLLAGRLDELSCVLSFNFHNHKACAAAASGSTCPLLLKSSREGLSDPETYDSGLFSCFAAIILTGALIISIYPHIPVINSELIPDCYYAPVSAADFLDRNAHTDVRLYTGYNNGAYMRFRGYDTYIDARTEVYVPRITGSDKNYLEEYLSLKNDSDFDYSGFIERYDFTHLLIEKDTFMYVYVHDHPSKYIKEVDTEDYALFVVAGK